ncbi:MAG: UpxY family transcription antiterminator [Prevotella sp.]|jgi:hypothetical protein|nr:UpxY family transcription antiterminator [Prevotella sp.]
MQEDHTNELNTSTTCNQEADTTDTWYAIRLFTNCQMKVDQYFRDNGLESFIPMQYKVFEDEKGRPKKKLWPVVSNLIFVRKSKPLQAMKELFTQNQYKMSVITRDRSTREYYEIPAKQMMEFKAMCNPEIEMRKFLSSEQAKLKAGTPVKVCHGPLKGLTGRLVRQSRKYYLLKEVPGLGVMLKVSRWCCQPLTE